MLIIGDISGLRMHRRFGPRLTPTRITSLERSTSAEREWKNFDLVAFNQSFDKLHVVIDSPAKRRADERVTTHLFSKGVPEGSLLELKKGVYVASVALCLIHASRGLSNLELIRLCYEVCSCYEIVWVCGGEHGGGDISGDSVFPGDVRGRFESRECQPLTTVAQLSASLAHFDGIMGASRILKALRYVANGSASPRETDMAMLAWCPHYLGGYGFRVALMNHTILIDGKQRRCDLLFKDERVGVEYDSDVWHAGSVKNSIDSARQKQIEQKGYRVISITNGELKDYTLADSAMTLLGKCLGVRVRKPRGRAMAARRELHAFINTEHQPMF